MYATCSDGKRKHLEERGVHFIATSRDRNLFKEEMTAHLNGEKLDVVFNSLNGDYIPFSVDFLKEGGVFLEIGKRDIWTKEKMSATRPDIKYHIIALDTLLYTCDPVMPKLCKAMTDNLNDWLEPLPPTNFDLENKYLDGFTYLQKGQNIGKVCLTRESNPSVCSGTILITGGTGGLGKLFTKFLVKTYPNTKIVLMSRSGTNPFPELKQVESLKCDVSNISDLKSVLTPLLPSLVGVIHARRYIT